MHIVSEALLENIFLENKRSCKWMLSAQPSLVASAIVRPGKLLQEFRPAQLQEISYFSPPAANKRMLPASLYIYEQPPHESFRNLLVE